MILRIKNLFIKHQLIAKNISLLFSLRILQRLLGFGTIFVLARTLNKYQFGQYNFVLTLIAYLGIFNLSGMNDSIMQSVARGYKGVFREAIPIVIKTSLIGSCIFAGLGIWYYFYNDYQLFYGLVSAALIFPLSHGLTQWTCVKTGEEDFSSFTKWTSIISFSSSTLVILSAMLYSGSYFFPLLFILLIPALFNVLLTYKTHKVLGLAEPVEKGFISYGLKLSAYSIFFLTSKYIDKILIYIYFTPTTLAIFIAAERLPELCKNIIQDIAAVLAPKFARQDKFNIKFKKFTLLFSLLTGIGLLFVTFIILPWGITFIFGSKYNVSIPYAQILLCTVIIIPAATLQFRYIKSQQDSKSVRQITLMMSLSRILASCILIPVYGITGAIISTIIFRIISATSTYIIIKRKYYEKTNE